MDHLFSLSLTSRTMVSMKPIGGISGTNAHISPIQSHPLALNSLPPRHPHLPHIPVYSRLCLPDAIPSLWHFFLSQLRKGSPQKEWTQMLISKNDPTIPTPAHKLVTSRHTTWHILENSLSIAHKLVTSRDTFWLIQLKSASEWVSTAKGIFARIFFKSQSRYVDI